MSLQRVYLNDLEGAFSDAELDMTLQVVNGEFVCLLYGKHTMRIHSMGKKHGTLTFRCHICGIKRTYRRRAVHRLLTLPGTRYSPNYRTS